MTGTPVEVPQPSMVILIIAVPKVGLSVCRRTLVQAAEKVHLLCCLRRGKSDVREGTPHSSLPDLTGASHTELFEQPAYFLYSPTTVISPITSSPCGASSMKSVRSGPPECSTC